MPVRAERGRPAAAPAPKDRATAEIISLASDLVGRIWGQFQARVAEVNLSLPEAKALQILDSDRSVSMRELAARLHANPSNVTVSVGRLEARGLVRRQGADDRRVKGVVLTPAGLELRRRLEVRLAEDHPAVRGLSAGERQALLQLLRRLSATH